MSLIPVTYLSNMSVKQHYSFVGEKTDGWMGVSEILIAHGVCGVIWGFVAGQPLCIQAAVGPFLVFEESLYKVQKKSFFGAIFCNSNWTIRFYSFVKVLAFTFWPFEYGRHFGHFYF